MTTDGLLMADRVQIEVVRNLTDMARGERGWLEMNERVQGMVDSGNWRIIDREISAPVRKARNVAPSDDQPQ